MKKNELIFKKSRYAYGSVKLEFPWIFVTRNFLYYWNFSPTSVYIEVFKSKPSEYFFTISYVSILTGQNGTKLLK